MITALLDRRVVLVAFTFTLACGRDAGELPSGVPIPSPSVADDSPRLSSWSAPVNLGAPVNGTLPDVGPAISRDGLSLYFGAGTGPGDFDIYVSHRASPEAAWGTPQKLGMAVNSTGDDIEPVLSTDGHRLYFSSNRGGGLGGTDLYVSRRRDKRDDFGWETPVNLGSGVNTAANEDSPTFYEDDATGTLTMYFESNRAGGPGNADIYSSMLLPDGSFGPAVVDAALSSALLERQPTIRRDGLEIFFLSNRLPRVGMTDLWVSTRPTTSDSWSAPVNLGPVINTTFVDGSPGLSFDGTTLYFHSNANRAGRAGPCSGEAGPCAFDIYASTRRKLTASDRE